MSLEGGPAAASAPPVHPGITSVLVVGALVAVTAAVFVGAIVVPYYVNNLDALPLAEVASGAHDPKDLWPQGAAGATVQLTAFLAIALTPLTAFVGAAMSGTLLLRRSAGARVRTGSVLVLGLSLAVLGAYFSPFGSALTIWRMD